MNKYSGFLTNLINILKLKDVNIVLSLYYLYKYNLNQINHVNIEDDLSLFTNLVIISLILSNKTFNDQSYTLKTWKNIINEQDYKISLPLLNQLENHFLTVTNYQVNFNKIDQDDHFWNSFDCSNATICYFRKIVSRDIFTSGSSFTHKTCTPTAPSSVISTPIKTIMKTPYLAYTQFTNYNYSSPLEPPKKRLKCNSYNPYNYNNNPYIYNPYISHY